MHDNSDAAIAAGHTIIALEPVALPIETVPQATGLARTRVFEAVANNELTARKHGKALGRLVPTIETGVDHYRRGFSFLCYSGDVWVLHDALAAAVTRLREPCTVTKKEQKKEQKR